MTAKMTNQTNQIKLMQLAWKLLDEEVEVLNLASRKSIGIKLVYKNDKINFIRLISRKKKQLLVRLAEKIVEKKITQIDLRENQIDQLKVRIIIRKYLSKLLLKFALLKLYKLLQIANENPVGFFRFIRAR